MRPAWVAFAVGTPLLAMLAPAQGVVGALWNEHGTASSWEWGPAVDGPTGAVGFHTNLRGNYNAHECSAIDSPVVARADVGDDLAVRFEQWYRIEASFGTARDGGVALLRIDGGAWTPLALDDHVKVPRANLAACLAESGLPSTTPLLSGFKPSWQSEVVPIPEHDAAATLQLRFLFLPDSTIRFEGWSLRNVHLGDAYLLL